jgi:tetratricopeptide (TPR) repeat protein
MKKLHVLLALMLMSAAVFAQSRNLRNADSELKKGRLDKAVAAIRLAMEEPVNQADANAWFSQAKIYTAVTITQKPEYKGLESNSVELAFQSFQRAFALDKSGKLILLGSFEVQKLINAVHDIGANLYAEQKFTEAANAFKLVTSASELIDVVDTNTIFNAALCADFAGDKAMAKEYYQKLVDLGANQPPAYTGLAIIYKDEGDFENTTKYVELLIELFPEEYTAMINAASIFLMIGNSERASEVLTTMSEKYADNPLVFFAKGVAFDQIKMPEEAEKAYLTAIELKEDYFDAIFNLGAHYVNRGVEIKSEADGLGISPDEIKKYEELTEKSNIMFRKAVPMLEKALELRSDEIAVMETLRDIYVHLRMMDKAEEINAKIQK